MIPKYTKFEDEQILHMKDNMGMKWREIHVSLPHRSIDSIRIRYHLLKRGNVQKQGWDSIEDGYVIEQLLRGMRYTEVFVAGRSRYAIINRCKYLLKEGRVYGKGRVEEVDG